MRRGTVLPIAACVGAGLDVGRDMVDRDRSILVRARRGARGGWILADTTLE